MRIINFILASEVSAKKILRQLEERREAVERLELTDPHPELSKAMESLERLERLEQVVARFEKGNKENSHRNVYASCAAC